MNPSKLIIKKREGKKLNKKEINFFISQYLNNQIPEYQMSAMLMAILLKGMDFDETSWLTESYINSGIILDFKNEESKLVDKHSTGGVGDKVSIILAPIAAECGICVPMISGRGLGHTGGTLDKLESIPGLKTVISIDKLRNIIKQNRCAIISQSNEIVPADKRIYALRDVTGTIESIPLITASIMSKKIAEGIDGLVIDLKVGEGAFIDNMKKAHNLAKFLIKIGKKFGKKVHIVFTDMNSPIGQTIGNAIEVIESIEFLKGNRAPDLEEITISLIKEMLLIANITKNRKKAENIVLDAMNSGRALERFSKLIELQGGNAKIIDDYNIIKKAKYKIPFLTDKSGYINEIKSKKIGQAIIEVSAGRKKITDEIDPSAGVKLNKKVGDKVEKGEVLGELYYNNGDGKYVAKEIKNSFSIKEKIYMHRKSRILEIMR